MPPQLTVPNVQHVSSPVQSHAVHSQPITGQQTPPWPQVVQPRLNVQPQLGVVGSPQTPPVQISQLGESSAREVPQQTVLTRHRREAPQQQEQAVKFFLVPTATSAAPVRDLELFDRIQVLLDIAF